MALDAALLALTAGELKNTLLDAKIDKIFEPTRDEVLLTLRTRTDTFKLLLSARSGSARICLTKETFENPQTPPSFCMLLRKHLSFCMLLRKHLTGGRLTALEVEPGDRLVFLRFLCTNEMGDLVENVLAVELMGRYSNLVLTQNGRIIDALKRVDFEDSDIRQLLPGLPYTLPAKPAKADFCSMTSAQLVEAACKLDLPLHQALIKSCAGVGPVVLREAVFRAFGGETALLASELDEDRRAALTAAFEAIHADRLAGGRPCLAADDEGKPVEFSFTALTQYGEGRLQFYDSFSEMLEAYYCRKDRAERLRQKSRDLHKTVSTSGRCASRRPARRNWPRAARPTSCASSASCCRPTSGRWRREPRASPSPTTTTASR